MKVYQEQDGRQCATSCVEAGTEAYLPGTGDTVITKAVLPGRDPSIALRSG